MTRVTRTHIFSRETCQKLHLLHTATCNLRFEHFSLARAHNSAISNTTMKQDTFLLRARLGLLIIAFPGTLEGLKNSLT